MKTKQVWLNQLRKCQTEETLVTVAERINKRISGEEQFEFQWAVERRLAEIMSDKHYGIMRKN